MRQVLAALLLLLGVGSPGALAQDVRMTEPRPFGYFLGDLVARTAEFDGPPGEEFAQASLPQPGPVNYWLELRSIDVRSQPSGDGMHHTLRLVYQVFYAPIDPKKVVIPQRAVQLWRGETTRSVTIPSFTLVMSPIREIFPEKSGETAATFLRPDAPAALVATGHLRSALAASLASSLILLAMLSHQLAWWPFGHRAHRPFTRAARIVASLLRASATADAYRSALISIHRAFDETAGRRLLPADADAYFEHHPEHAPSRSGIERFFEASRLVFFADDVQAGQDLVPPNELKALAMALAREERASL